MFVLAQNKVIVNLDNSVYTKIEKNVKGDFRIVSQVGFQNHLKAGLVTPIVEVLGEYETQEDADYAFDKLWSGIFSKSPCMVTPPYNTDEDGT